MRTLPIAAVVAAMVLAAAAPVVGRARASAASLCRAGEPQTFSCPVGRKLVSICGEGARAVYRFGLPGRVELEAKNPTTAQIGYSGGGETQAAFSNQGYTYVVYDRTVRTRFTPDGRHDPAFSQGLLVMKGGRVLSNRPCRGDATLTSQGVDGMTPGPAVDH